ncbi:MAG: DAK2 domain-containing protein [Ruminococcaceae bacterium]|nr:DAK2 domain-containing protein [Oscillospiraceae bacterium]
MAEDKKKATPSPSAKQAEKKPVRKTIKGEDVAKIAASTAQTIKKAAKTSVHQTAVAIIKVQDATKKKQEQKKAERAAAAKDPNAKKKTTWQDIKVMGGNLLSKMAKGGAMQLRSNAEEVNKLNVFPVPDGDTGDNMRMTIESGVAAIENLETDNLADVMKAFSHGMLLGARGNSGVILSQFFAGTAKGIEGVDQADPAAFGRALQRGVQQAYTSVMTPTEGTILTVAREAVEYAVARITPESTISTLFSDLVGEMRASLERTPEILSVLREAGVVDSGGAGLFYIMDGFNRVLNGEEILGEEQMAQLTANAKPASVPEVDLDGFGPDSVMTYGYCTELLVRLQNSKTNIATFNIDALKAFLATVGDSIVAFQTDSIVKIHVHTLTPEKVLAHCRTFGEFLKVKIENMSLQHSSVVEGEKEEAPAPAKAEAPAAPAKKYGVVAVCTGPGIEQLYRDFGTDEVVEGGQTQNPSTNDFLDAFAKVNAEHIFVFPNNGNIFMAAQQAADIYTAAKIHVIPSKNIGSGYVALSCANFECEDAEIIANEMTEALGRVTAGYVSPSIRDAEINGVTIKNGDTIGIIGKEIVLSNPDQHAAALGLTEKILEGDKFMLTVFCGKDASSEQQAALQADIQKIYPAIETYFIDGGQDIYPFIFVAE